MTTLDAPTWRARQAAHEARVDAWIGEHLQRRQHGKKHPVEDFLFTYYSYQPGKLRRWHPGIGIALADADFGPGYIQTDEGMLVVDADAAFKKRERLIEWVMTLLQRTAERSAHLGCFGMHEWAMVYRQSAEDVRHTDYPLRLTPMGTNAVVEANQVRCSHFDAYRFFTEPARPLNVLQPTRETQANLDQPGCLHANMDLYKWAYKLSPLTGSDLIADCFELAREIRTMDMRASPYDLVTLGYQPIRIETAEGRAEYAAAQRAFARRAAPLRQQLIDVCRQMLTWRAGSL